jgi:hypothetical protein
VTRLAVFYPGGFAARIDKCTSAGWHKVLEHSLQNCGKLPYSRYKVQYGSLLIWVKTTEKSRLCILLTSWKIDIFKLKLFIFLNNQLDAQFFFMFVYFYSLHVSGSHVPIIRRINCINTTSGIRTSMSLCIDDRLVYRFGRVSSNQHTKLSSTQSGIYHMYWYN